MPTLVEREPAHRAVLVMECSRRSIQVVAGAGVDLANNEAMARPVTVAALDARRQFASLVLLDNLLAQEFEGTDGGWPVSEISDGYVPAADTIQGVVESFEAVHSANSWWRD
jgi:hypothetical protein